LPRRHWSVQRRWQTFFFFAFFFLCLSLSGIIIGMALDWLRRIAPRLIRAAPAETDNPVEVLHNMTQHGVTFPVALVRVRIDLEWDQGLVVLPPAGQRTRAWVAPRVRLVNAVPTGTGADSQRRDLRHRLLNRLAAATQPAQMAAILEEGLRGEAWTVEWDKQPFLLHPRPVAPNDMELIDRVSPRRFFVQ
jgi:hypothetical protein